MINLKIANNDQIPQCLEIIESARLFQRQQGFIQWLENAPSKEDVINDISNGNGYVLLDDNRIIGYAFIGFDGEPTYKTIDGNWHSNDKYCVIHRFAIASEYRNKGYSHLFFEQIIKSIVQRNIHYIRIDTHKDNARMQHIILREGFQYCGIVKIPTGERISYDMIIKQC